MMDAKAFSVVRFCATYGLSKPLLYQLWREGRGPRSYTVNRRRYISVEAAECWQRDLENEANEHREAA